MTDIPPAVEMSAAASLADAAPDVSASAEAPPIIARAGRYYRNMRYLMVLGLFGFAAAFAYDGFKAWPARNVAIQENNAALDSATNDEARAALAKRQQELGAPKPEFDITLQKRLAFALPVAAIAYLVFFLRRSRGEIKLERDTLFVPGYTPVPLASILSVDSTLWKKKGVAVVHFQDGGKSSSLTLDDFIYQQKPIDAIYDRLLNIAPAAVATRAE